MTFITVFDVAQEGYLRDAYILLMPLMSAVIGALLIFAPDAMQTMLPYGPQGRDRQILNRFIFIVSILAFNFFIITIFSDNWKSIHRLQYGQYSMVEGPVLDFVPPPVNGHGAESFTVGGQRFSYTLGSLTPGFRPTAGHGEPIQPGRYVRISYAAGAILRLQLAKE